MADYLSARECSANLKQELKTKWSSVSWSVRKDGNCLRVSWTDGPTERDVMELAGKYAGSSFDGMTDCDTPTGNLVRVKGTLYKPLVRYVFPERSFTVEFLGAIARDYCKQWGYQVPEVKSREDGSSAYLVRNYAQMTSNGYETIADEVYREIKQISVLSAGVKASIRKEVARLKSFPEVAPAAKQEQPAAASETSEAPAIIHNRDWTWIHFPAQPPEATREAIKALGFAFSNKRSAIKKCSAWFAKSHVEIDTIEAVLQGAPAPQEAPEEAVPVYPLTLWDEPEAVPDVPQVVTQAAPVQDEKEQIAATLNAKADALQPQIEKKRQSSYYTNPHTRRQRNIADSIQSDIDRMERIQTALRALAEAHESGWVPWELQYIRTRAEVERLLANYDNGENPRAKSELRALLAKATLPVDPTAKKIKELERDLIGCQIPGYFPTPQAVIEEMLLAADMRDGLITLEPSAGKGNIADTLLRWEGRLDTIEYQHQLSEILRLKGHEVVASNFLLYEQGGYDRIIMNPPFEKWQGHWQDIQHVQHAYELLKSGGRLVSIMSSGPFHRTDRESIEFRVWLQDVNGYYRPLPGDAFKSSERPTGTQTYLVVIDRQAETLAESA